MNTNLKVNKEVIMDNQQITETVNNLFISPDNRDWQDVKLIFGDTVLTSVIRVVSGRFCVN